MGYHVHPMEIRVATRSDIPQIVDLVNVAFGLRGERAYFGLLSVDPDHQRQGLGHALVDKVERRAKEAGCGIMDILTVNVRPELVPLYSKMGYAESGTAPFPAHVRIKMPCHFVRMSKDLE
jgi:GNAT superfamily N-acetyltransferase